MRRAALFHLVLLAGLLRPADGAAQQFGATGSLTAYGELYSRDGIGTANRPDETGRITANLTLSLFNGLLTAPLTAIISSDQVSFRQQINQIGVSPTYKWATFHAGNFTPEYSRYTIADATLLGGGVDLHPGLFRIGAVYGRSRRAIAGNGNYTQIQWAQWMYGGRLGYGDEQKSFLDLFLVRGEDDRNSLDTAAVFPVPPVEASTVAGYKGQLSFGGGRVQLQSEGALSRYRRDELATNEEVTDKSAQVKLLFNSTVWSIGGTVEYVGPGFVTLGNSGLAGDRIDYGLTGSARLSGGRLALQGMAGWRENNLDGDLEATAKQAIYNFSGSWQPGTAVGIDWQVANNVNDNRARDDTSSIKNVTGVYSLTPRLLWRTGSVQHVLVVAGSYQSSENTTPGSISLLDTKTTTVVANYTAAFASSLSFIATATYTKVDLDTLGTSKITTVAPGLSYAFFNRKVQAQAQAQFMHADNPNGQNEHEVFPLVSLRWTVARGQSFLLRTSYRHHEFSNTGDFNEQIVSLQYSAAFR
ncbi:MAG: hypothetical protein AB7I33_13560 [Gemmatimonadales bacterium]